MNSTLMNLSPALALAADVMHSGKEKRRPLLIDQFLAEPPGRIVHGNKQDERTLSAVRAHLREAKIFRLDNKAAIYAAEFIRDYPEAIAHDQEFAIPCFPRMYIELPYPDFYATLGGQNVHDPLLGDTDVGYFIDGPCAYVMSRIRDSETLRLSGSPAAGMMPIRYRLNKPFTVEEEQAVCEKVGVTRIGIDLLYWGSSFNISWKTTTKINDAIRNGNPDVEFTGPREASLLRANHSFEQWYGFEAKNVLPDIFKSSAGDLRNIIALILFLNRTRDIRFDEPIPPKQGWIGPRPATLVRHHVVRIKLDPKPMLIKTYGGSGAWRRRHEVKGHFCHDAKAREARHHIVPYQSDGIHHEPRWMEYDINQWRCLTCGGKRWHRKAHARGHKEKGHIETKYEVTK